MPEGSAGGIDFDNEGVQRVVLDFKDLADAVGGQGSGAAAYAKCEATAEAFGRMPAGQKVGNDITQAVEQLAKSLGTAGSFMTQTAEAIRAAGDTTMGIDDDTATGFNNTQV